VDNACTRSKKVIWLAFHYGLLFSRPRSQSCVWSNPPEVCPAACAQETSLFQLPWVQRFLMRRSWPASMCGNTSEVSSGRTSFLRHGSQTSSAILVKCVIPPNSRNRNEWRNRPSSPSVSMMMCSLARNSIIARSLTWPRLNDGLTNLKVVPGPRGPLEVCSNSSSWPAHSL